METQHYSTHIAHTCPYCNTAPLETTATAPFVRGFILAVQYGAKSYIGCLSCVRKKVLSEAGKSALLGWFSITALFVNPILIVYNLIQAGILKEKKGRVKKKLRDLGLPEDGQQADITNIGYALAISMIKADGKVDKHEIMIAEQIGQNIFPNFDEARFRQMIQDNPRLPSTKDLALILKDAIGPEGKEQIYSYIAQIAQADGKLAPAEQQLLQDLAQTLSIPMQSVHAS